jgi:hypothetical protein
MESMAVKVVRWQAEEDEVLKLIENDRLQADRLIEERASLLNKRIDNVFDRKH